jgi:calpain-6
MYLPFSECDYNALRKRHQELGSPWTDPDFPADETSIGPHAKLREFRNGGDITWKRPHEIAARPKLFARHGNSHQGKDGDCWFIAAALAFHESRKGRPRDVWKNVIPELEDQDWDETNPRKYAGIFKFQFWQMGDWIEVLVDDLLPVTENDELLFAGPNVSKNQKAQPGVAGTGSSVAEFWLALMEKAYAKLHGNYSAIYGTNFSSHAFEELTGGLTEGLWDVNQLLPKVSSKEMFFKKLKRDKENGALMSCAIQRENNRADTKRVGLEPYHSYAIVDFKEIRVRQRDFDEEEEERMGQYLLKLHNPWGYLQWNGDLSYLDDTYWDLTPKDLDELNTKKFGKFWIPLKPFLEHFTLIEICHTTLDPLDYTQFLDTWSTCGFLELFRPQYKFEVKEKDSLILIELSQSETGLCYRKQIITFDVIKVADSFTSKVFRKSKRYHASVQYPFDTSFLKFIAEETGTYLIVPRIVIPYIGERIMLRIMADHHFVKNVRRAGWGILGGLFSIF